jgi:anti-anti-sigma regulatory factor
MTVPRLVFYSTDDGVLVAPPHCGLLTVPDFLHHVQAWCERTPAPLVIDLSQVEEFESGAFRALVWARRYCLSHGVAVSVVEPGPGVLRPHELALLRDLFRAEVPPADLRSRVVAAEPVVARLPRTRPVG